MVRTRVGYTGGKKKNPTYQDLGDHTETIQIDFDPSRTSYEKLLALFWATHNPCGRAGSRQYMSAVFYHNDIQKKLALESRERQAAQRKAAIATEVMPAGEFYLAEDYHQKFFLKQHRDLVKEFTAIYPEAKNFVASTAVARVNGYVGGNGSEAEFRKEIGNLGLSADGVKTLERLWKPRR